MLENKKLLLHYLMDVSRTRISLVLENSKLLLHYLMVFSRVITKFV